MVNLVVKDINDNAPLFGMDSVAVGYPSADIAEVVLPRALAELKVRDFYILAFYTNPILV